MSADHLELPDFAAVQAAEQRIRPLLAATPVLEARDLADDLGMPLWFKCENLQRTGSFKARGASNWVQSATERELADGLVTVSEQAIAEATRLILTGGNMDLAQAGALAP